MISVTANKESSIVEKSCSMCKVIKHLNDFHLDKTKPSGRSSKCKECAKLYARWTLKKRLECQTRYVKRDRDAFNKYMRELHRRRYATELEYKERVLQYCRDRQHRETAERRKVREALESFKQNLEKIENQDFQEQ